MLLSRVDTVVVVVDPKMIGRRPRLQARQKVLPANIFIFVGMQTHGLVLLVYHRQSHLLPHTLNYSLLSEALGEEQVCADTAASIYQLQSVW